MRRRLVAAFLIVLANLAVLAWVDNLILLRNPKELDTRARLILQKLVPDWNPEIGHIEVDFPSRVVVEDLAVKEKGTGLPLATIKRVEAVLSLSDWLQPREVLIRGLRANLRRSKDGKLNLDVPASSGGGLRLASDVTITIEDARLRFEDEDVGSRSLVTCDQARVTVFPNGEVKGRGSLAIGALVGPSSPFYPTGVDVTGEPGWKKCDIVPFASFEVERTQDGRVRLPIEVGNAKVGPLLRSVLPRYVQEVIWSELNPTGTVDARVTLRLFGTEMEVRPEVYVHAKGCTLNPKKFPYPITDIKGRFEISPGIVSWEDVTAATAGAGLLKSRGSFFLGNPEEKVTLFIYIDAREVPFDETLRSAMPPDVRAVYDQFGVAGTCGPSKVLIFKGPFMDEPAISVRSDVTGGQSAAFADYPVRFTATTGSFTLKEGGNVEVDADGSFEIGGHGHVAARIVHGDLIHVRVSGEGVPIGPSLISKLDQEVARMVEPFRPSGGKAGFEITVAKSDPAGRAVPRVEVDLDGVGVEPEAFPYRVRTDGHVEVIPSWREGALAGERPEVEVDLALRANAPGVTAAVISGTIVLDAKERGEFSGGLDVRCSRIELDRDVQRAFPPEVAAIVDRIAPRGGVKNVRARVLSPRSFDIQGEGDLLTAALDAFPYRAQIQSFDIARSGRVISLRSVEGKAALGGRFSLDGQVELPRETNGQGEATGTQKTARDPIVNISVRAEMVPIERSLLEALPEDARAAIAKLEPEGGHVDASLRIGLAPLLPPDITGTVSLAGARVRVALLAADLAGLASSPIEDVRGTLRFDGERIHIDGLKASFRGAPVSAGGSVAMRQGSESVQRPALDLIAHIDGLEVDEATRKLARGKVLAALERYPIEGPCDLDLRVRRTGESPTIDVRVSPRGVKVVPKILPLPFEDVRGTFEIKNGEPAFVDLKARLKQAEIEVKRGASPADARESFAPPGTAIFRVKARGLVPTELENDAPADFVKVVRDLDLKGSLDVGLALAVPMEDDRAKIRFLAEVRTSAFAITAGLRFEDVKGTLRVAGSVAKFEPLEIEGALALDSASWKKQVLTNAQIPIHMKDALLSFGTPREPFTATFYKGPLRGRVDMNLKTEQYSGYLFLDKASLQEAAQQLSRLQ
ncbi:hypothetical protein HY251_20485 [bacterium]|nr:hypothetical protein [bacterium]